MNSGKWQQIFNFDTCRDLYTLVTPETDRDEILLIRFSDKYRAFSYVENEKVLAFGVVYHMEKNKSLMIDLFALDTSIRGKGLARLFFNSFMEQLSILWPEVTNSKKCWLLEAYLQNVEPWCKIMEMQKVDTNIKAIKVENPIQLLSHDVKDVDAAYTEWQEFQMMW